MMRGYLTPARRALVHRAFRKMDKDGSGVIDWTDLQDVYNVKQHPKVLSDEFSEEQALTDVLSKYGDESFHANGDGKLSQQEFEQYYANVGANIDTDEYFELMMRQAWRL
jgi:calcyphosin